MKIPRSRDESKVGIAQPDGSSPRQTGRQGVERAELLEKADNRARHGSNLHGSFGH